MATCFTILASEIPQTEGYGPCGRKELDTTERLSMLEGLINQAVTTLGSDHRSQGFLAVDGESSLGEVRGSII